MCTARCNEALSIIGLLEDYTTDTSVAGTQDYAFPSGATIIRQVTYDGDRLKRISFRQWEWFKDESGTISGEPSMFVVWNDQIKLVPEPEDSGDTIGIYYYKEHPFIDGTTQTTIDIPSVLHVHIARGVISDMYAKDLNPQMASYYEDLWQNRSIPAFQDYKRKVDNAGQFHVMGDADTDDFVGPGIV